MIAGNSSAIATWNNKNMPMLNLYCILALFTGLILALQVGVNTNVAKVVNNSFVPLILSFVIGTLVLITYALISRQNVVASLLKLNDQPWWLWTGGLLGASYVWLAIVIASKLGATQLLAFVISGQLITSLIIDHYGLFGFTLNPINPYKLLGVFLLFAGMICIRKF